VSGKKLLKSHSSKKSSGKKSSGKKSLGKMRLGKMRLGKMRLGKMRLVEYAVRAVGPGRSLSIIKIRKQEVTWLKIEMLFLSWRELLFLSWPK